MTSFKNLFAPGQIGKLEVKNRIVMPPMATNFADAEGTVNDRHIAYYRRRARGGAGLIIFEHTGVVKQGKAFPNMALIDSDDKIPPFKKLVQAVHQENGKILYPDQSRRASDPFFHHRLSSGGPLPDPLPDPPGNAQSALRQRDSGVDSGLRRGGAAGEEGRRRRRGNPYGPWIPAESIPFPLFQPAGRRIWRKPGAAPQHALGGAAGRPEQGRGRIFPSPAASAPMNMWKEACGSRIQNEIAREAGRTWRRCPARFRRHRGLRVSDPSLPITLPEGVFVPLAAAIKSVVRIPVITVGRIRTPGLSRPNHKRKQGRFCLHGAGLDRRPGTARESPGRIGAVKLFPASPATGAP